MIPFRLLLTTKNIFTTDNFPTTSVTDYFCLNSTSTYYFPLRIFCSVSYSFPFGVFLNYFPLQNYFLTADLWAIFNFEYFRLFLTSKDFTLQFTSPKISFSVEYLLSSTFPWVFSCKYIILSSSLFFLPLLYSFSPVVHILLQLVPMISSFLLWSFPPPA